MFGRNFGKVSIATLAILGAAALASPASAEVITFELDTTVEGDTPSGFPTMTFTDAGANTVTLEIDADGLSGGEFISNLFFNYTGAGSELLTFTRTGGSGPSSGYTITQGDDNRDSPGNQGLFDIQIAFSTSNSGGGVLRFNADEFLTFSIVGDGLTAADFDVISAPEGPSDGANFALARIQGIAGGGSASVADGDGGGGGENEVPVPEPAAIGLLGLGLLGISLGRRRRKA